MQPCNSCRNPTSDPHGFCSQECYEAYQQFLMEANDDSDFDCNDDEQPCYDLWE